MFAAAIIAGSSGAVLGHPALHQPRAADGRRRAAAVSASGRVRLRRPVAGGEKIYYFFLLGSH